MKLKHKFLVNLLIQLLLLMHGCLDHDTAHAFHTLLVGTPKVYLTSVGSACGDKGLFSCGDSLCNPCCEMSGCICEIPSLCNVDEESTTSSTTGSCDLPALEGVMQIRAELVEALDRALYINEAAEFQQKPCVCKFSALPAMESSNGCMFCSD